LLRFARNDNENAARVSGAPGLPGALDDITALSDRARSLQDELTTRLTQETNRRLYIVSVVTALFMPATFVTGFFGMNTGGLLWGGDEVPHGTLFVSMLCGSAVIITLLLLRAKKLL
jgi:Mg2+ and Co2+ transporter CorA